MTRAARAGGSPPFARVPARVLGRGRARVALLALAVSRVLSRGRGRVALLALAVSVGGCAPTAASLRKPDAQLLIVCPVDDARVYLDETFVGRAVELRRRPLAVVHGALRVEVRADGWFTAYRDVPVAPGARGRVDVSLRRVPDGEPGG